MQTLDLVQGSDEWLAMRHLHNNASEAAAMLGIDPRTKRTELLKMRKFGKEKEFSDWVRKNILDKGHEVEESARKIIEAEIGEDLYPVSASDDDGWLYASVDGITMLGDTFIEHKQWNQDLANFIKSNDTIPDYYMAQVQQNFIVTEAVKCLFIVSDGTTNKRIVIEILPDRKWFERIKSGWIQFEKDLETFVPDAEPETIIPEVVENLPALSIQTTGEISIQSNLDLFGAKLTDFVSSLNLKPDNDQDFADAEAAIKILLTSEESLDAGERYAISQMSSVEEMRSTIAKFSNIARDTRLALQKVVKNRKNELKQNAIQSARLEFINHVRELEKEISPYRLNIREPDFVAATKNLRTLESFRDAVSTTLANGKIESDRLAKEAREKLSEYKTIASGYEFLFADLQDILSKPLDDFKNAIQIRIDSHAKEMEEKAKVEQERLEREQKEREREKAITPETEKNISEVIVTEISTIQDIQPLDINISVKLESMKLLCAEVAKGNAPEYVLTVNYSDLVKWMIKNNISHLDGVSIHPKDV